jgi:hypothetical protein
MYIQPSKLNLFSVAIDSSTVQQGLDDPAISPAPEPSWGDSSPHVTAAVSLSEAHNSLDMLLPL